MSEGIKRSKPYIRSATREDCITLSKNLRQADLEEISHAYGLLPEQTLLLGYRTSTKTWAVVLGDEIVAIFGIGGFPGVVGFPWMLASSALTKIRKSFLSGCRGVIEEMLSMYPNLENQVWSGNTTHIQWLRWLGFTVEPPALYGITGQPFHRFYMKDKHVRTDGDSCDRASLNCG